MIKARLYSTSQPAGITADDVVFVVARPTPGRHIGWVGTSGFKVMAIPVADVLALEEAHRMDAQGVQLVGPDFEQSMLDEHEYAAEYRALIDDGTITLRRIAVDCGWTHIDITPVGTDG